MLKVKSANYWQAMIVVIFGLFCLATHCGWCNSKVIVVASNSWTGAIAQAAGADEVRILAPLELKHPAEYDYRPTDLAKLQDASLIVYGGYEPFVKKIVAAANYPETKVVKVVTTNVPEILIQQARLLAEKLNTQKAEIEWEKNFEKVVSSIQQRAKLKKINKTRVVVHEHQKEVAKWLGYDIVGSFGIEELSPAKVLELAKLNPDLIIDNFHSPQGKPIWEIAKCRYVELINFPSVKAPTLVALIEEDTRRLGI